MILKELVLSDFGIYAGTHCLRFKSDVNGNRNIILIGGMNGRGKTTILEAVFLAFYGNRSPIFRESGLSYSAYLAKCINKASSEHCSSLKLHFEIPVSGSMLCIKIRRSWQGKKQRITDNLEVCRNGQPDSHLSKHWDTYMEEILPMGISSLFFFDAEKVSRLAEEEETSDTVKESIKSLLGLDVVDRLSLDLKRLVSKKQHSLENLQVLAEANTLQDDIISIDNDISKLIQEKSNINTSLERKKRKLQEKEEAFIKQGGTLKDSRNTLLHEKNELREKLLLTKAELVSLASGPLPLLLVAPLLKKVNVTVKKDEEAKTARYVLSYLENFSQRMIKETQFLSAEAKDMFNSLLATEKTAIQKKQLAESIFGLSPIAQQQIHNILQTFNQSSYLDSLSSIENANVIEAQLDQIDRYLLVDTSELQADSMLSEIKKLYTEFAELELKQNKLAEQIASLQTKKTQLENQLNSTLQSVANAENAKNDTEKIIAYAIKSQEIMHAFKRKVTRKKVSKLAECITASFLHIIGKESLVSKITIDHETLRLTLYDIQDAVMLKSQLSAGEKQMLAIAILWGLAQASDHKLPVIIDTPLGRLDSSHRKNFITRYLPNASHQVIVLSTDEEVNDYYLEQLEDRIQQKYLLEYNEHKRATSVVEGYFQGKVS